MAVRQITKPAHVDHAELRAIVEHAVWVAKLEEVVEALEALVFEPIELNDERADAWAERDLRNDDPLSVAVSAVSTSSYEAVDQALEAELIRWHGADPEPWPIFRLMLLDPWQAAPGSWRTNTPRWVLSLGMNATTAHFSIGSLWSPA